MGTFRYDPFFDFAYQHLSHATRRMLRKFKAEAGPKQKPSLLRSNSFPRRTASWKATKQ